ncbi:PAS domain-containing protein [Foetidibacter luteolus]|uniref:PAS domain-containing protein n=1 Tax=Foetidibacter luteolus TaxID=2608880 RepID=UPI00129C0272|nr:PAS domain-containing protein [Foetidibacter luteolus]
MDNHLPAQRENFLKGGGEMAELIASINWAENLLGPISGWPQSLRTTLSILLHSKFPMFLFWGPHLICFYNDAYRPSLGTVGKHPGAMGSRGEDVWPEIWHIIKPLIDQVLSGGEATWSEDQLIPIYRNGKLEDVYWTFSYSPVHDETGKPAGVFVTCSETTQKVLSLKQLARSEEQFRGMIEQAPVGIAILSGPDFIVESANETYLQIVDKAEKGFVGEPLFAGLPEVKESIEHLLRNVYNTGQSYQGMEFEVTLNRYGKKEKAYFNFVYQPMRNANGDVSGILVVAYDVTNMIFAREALAHNEQRFWDYINASPVPIGIYEGRDMVIKTVNESILRTWNRDASVIGKTFREALPELEGQPFYQLLDDVYTTGIPYHTDGDRVDLMYNGVLQTFYFNFTYTPLKDQQGKVYGVLNTATDITKQIVAQKKLEVSEKKFRSLVNEAAAPTALLHGPDYVIELVNDAAIALWGKDKNVIGKPLAEALPELASQPFLPVLKHVYDTGEIYEGKENIAWFIENGKPKQVYLDVVFKRLEGLDADGSADILVMGYNVTSQVEARKEIEENEYRLQQTNQRLAMALEAGQLGSYDLELATGTMQCTAQCKANYGLSPHAVFNFPDLMDIILPDDREYVQQLVAQAIKEHKVYNSEYRIRWPDGSIHWIRASGVATYDEAGKPLKMAGVTMNITTGKLAMQRIQESEERLNMALDYTETGSWDLNLANRELIYSSRLPGIFGYKQGDEIDFKKLRAHFHPDDLHNVVEKAFEKAMETGIYFYEARLLRPDNSTRWVRTQGRVIYGNDGRPVRMLGTIVDITEARNEQARKDEFIGIISHELRTPLTSIKGFAQFLHERASEFKDEMSVTLLAKMVIQVNKLNKLIQDLLDVTRIEGGKLKFHTTKFNFGELVHEVADVMQVTTDKKIEINELDQDLMVTADRDRLGQVLINLLTNAIKYSPGQERIVVMVKKMDGQLVCDVTDFGIGITQENQKFVFERFYREFEGEANTFPGLGLGLYISAEIMKRQNGKISVKSNKGKGSTFSFSLPLNND